MHRNVYVYIYIYACMYVRMHGPSGWGSPKQQILAVLSSAFAGASGTGCWLASLDSEVNWPEARS